MAKNWNFLTPAKRRSPEKTRIHRNPEESWAGTKNRDLEMDIPETGKYNLVYTNGTIRVQSGAKSERINIRRVRSFHDSFEDQVQIDNHLDYFK